MTAVAFAPSRFDRPGKTLEAQLDDLTREHFIIGLTEVGDRHANLLRVPGWGWFRADGKGADDCAVLWDDEFWSLDGFARAVPLTSIVWQRVAKYGGGKTPPVHATVVPLRGGGDRLVVIVVHMPTRSTVLRRRAWASCVSGLVRLVKRIRAVDSKADVILMADWNADWHNAKDRALLEKAHQRLGLTLCWQHDAPDTGTHGKRLIDGISTEKPARARVLAPSPASDHRTVSADL